MEQITKKILVVEDEEEFILPLEQGLNEGGFSVVVAADGQEGFDVAKKENPDLILLDIRLPKMDGIALAKKLKEAGNKAPIIFLTNMKDGEHISDAMEAVPKTEYIIKSDMDVESIVERVKIRLGLK